MLWICLLLVWTSSAGAQNQKPAAQRTAPRPAAPAKRTPPPAAATTARSDAFLSGKPLTLEQVIKLLESVKADLVDNGRIMAAMRARKIAFTAKPEIEKQLKAYGAPDDLINLTYELSGAKRPDPTGELMVTCAPAECEISVNGGAYQSTRNGLLQLAGMPLKPVTLDFRREQYLGQQLTATPVVTVDSPVSVVLKPDPKAEREAGAKMLRKMLEAFGGDDGMKEMRQTTVGGSATSVDVNGALSEWTLSGKFAPPNLAAVGAQGPLGNLTLACRGESCMPKSGLLRLPGRTMRGKDAETIDGQLRLWRRYNMAALLDRWIAAGTSFQANRKLEQLDNSFQMATSDEVFTITLGPDWLPAQVVHAQTTGLGAPLTVQYSEWGPLGAGKFARRMQIKLTSGERPTGILLRFDSVSPEVQIKEKDFPE